MIKTNDEVNLMASEKSSRKMTECKCPKCGRKHKVLMEWKGRISEHEKPYLDVHIPIKQIDILEDKNQVDFNESY